jgi:O-antigen/teichoic acid export membrane protein
VTLVAQGSKLALQTASLVVLARLLTPADYGLIGMVTVVTKFAALFNPHISSIFGVFW